MMNRSSKAGTSERKETIVGEKYIQHYTEDGQKTGRSIDRENLLGGERRDYE